MREPAEILDDIDRYLRRGSENFSQAADLLLEGVALLLEREMARSARSGYYPTNPDGFGDTQAKVGEQ